MHHPSSTLHHHHHLHSHHLNDFGSTSTSTSTSSTSTTAATSGGPATSSSSSTSSSSIGHLGADPYVGANVIANGLTGNGPLSGGGGQPSDDMSPMARDRCNTWPLNRPQLDGPGGTQTSPLIHEQIPEEDDLFGSNEHCGRLGGSSNGSNALLHSPGMSSPLNSSALSPCEDSPDSAAKKATTRRNAWGNMSYADLITQAIIQSPDKRLTLAQVYEWMVQNVPYFRDKGDSNSSAGWKNSIRHNLSLHSRFMRIQNEGAGKSSWWVINPEAKPGRNPRRARDRSNTIDAVSKVNMERNRRGARKRVKERGLLGMNNGSQASIASHDLFDDDSMNGSFEPMGFRGRTHSNLSVPGSSARVSPSGDHIYEDLDFPQWVDSASNGQHIPSDIVDRTTQMRIDASNHINGNQTMIKQEQKPIKTEPITPSLSYHELNSVRGPCAQNPLLRNPIVPSTNFKPMPLPTAYASAFQHNWAIPSSMAGPPPLPNVQQSCGATYHSHQHHNQSAAAAAAAAAASSSALPIDLENLTLPDQPLMGMDMDVESLLRHELSQTRDHQLNFDL